MSYTQDSKSTQLDLLDKTTLDQADLHIVGDVSDNGRAKAITEAQLEDYIANSANFITQLTTNTTFIQNASPLTTKGDLYTFNTVNTRLPVGTDGQVLSADSSQATGLKWIASLGGGGGGTKIYQDTATVTFSGATTLYTIPIPGGTLGTNNAIRYKFFLSNSGSSTISVSVTYGGSSVGSFTIVPGSVSTSPIHMEGYVMASGATGSQKSFLEYIYNSFSGGSPGFSGTLPDTTINTTSIDSTATQNLVISISGVGANGQSDGIIVEKITDANNSGSNTVSLISGSTFVGATTPQAFSVGSGQKTLVSVSVGSFGNNFGDVTANSKFCYQLNICEGQSIHIDQIILRMNPQGSPSDNLICSIQGSTGSAPNGTILHSSTIASSSVSGSNATFNFTQFELNAPAGGGDIHLFVVVERSGAVDPVNYFIILMDNSGGTNTSPYKYNGTSWLSSDLKMDSIIKFTPVAGTAYLTSNGATGTKTANGNTGGLVTPARAYLYDVNSGSGNWVIISTMIADGMPSAGFIKENTSVGGSVTGYIAGQLNGFTGLTPGSIYYTSTGLDQGTIGVGLSGSEIGKAITNTTLAIIQA